MKKWVVISLSIVFLIIVIIIASLIFKPKTGILLSCESNVTRVIDGDTLEMDNGEIIRLLCVDTPEQNEQGYDEAKTFLESRVLCNNVSLESSTTDKDAYNRSLRYVYVDNIFVNKEILDKGYGELLVIPPENCSELL